MVEASDTICTGTVVVVVGGNEVGATVAGDLQSRQSPPQGSAVVVLLTVVVEPVVLTGNLVGASVLGSSVGACVRGALLGACVGGNVGLWLGCCVRCTAEDRLGAWVAVGATVAGGTVAGGNVVAGG